jgi:HEAT repeat protein
VAGYEPVHRLTGNIPANAFRDPDEQIRVEAARILLSTGVPAVIARVFKGVLSDTPGVRLAIAGDLARYAPELCQHAIPEALRSRADSLNTLQMLVSWERALPLTDIREVAECPDTAVRVGIMRLMPFLPATMENHHALLDGLNDMEGDVSAAAASAAARLRLSDSPAAHAPDNCPEEYSLAAE